MQIETSEYLPFFSFVMPAYKAKYIRESIDSILCQTYLNFELVIVNDASPENLDNIISSYTDSRIRYYENKENIGGKNLTEQWNFCVSYAKGDYFILATDDDIYSPTFLESFVPLIRKYNQTFVFRSRILSVDGEGKILWFDRCYKEHLSQGEFFYYYFQGIKGGIPQFIFKRKEFISKGGFVSFPLGWGSDDATALKLSNNGVVNSQDMLVKFRWSDINISSKNNYSVLGKKIEARIQLCEWLVDQVKKIKFDDTPIGQYCKKYVIDNLDYNVKIIVLRELLPLQPFYFLRVLYKLRGRSLFSKQHIISIIYRYIKNKVCG